MEANQMTKGDVTRLCGGTFFTQLQLSRKPSVSQRQRTQGETDVFHNEDGLFALLQIVQPDAVKPNFAHHHVYQQSATRFRISRLFLAGKSSAGGTYRILRENGEPADNLCEGEKNFIAFRKR
jgi:hypothetical protein